MKSKPLFFNVMGVVFLALAISLPLQIWALYQVNDLGQIFGKLTHLNWAMAVVFTLMAMASFKVNKILLALIPFASSLVFVNNWVVQAYGSDYSPVQTLFASVCFSGLCATFYLPKFNLMLQDSKHRWWIPKPRFKQSLPVQILYDDQKINGISFDISETGIFVQEDHLTELSKIHVGEVLTMQINLPQGLITCEAQVVRKSRLKEGNYPAGVGLKFIQPSRFLKNCIGQVKTDRPMAA